ncbi:MAG: serine hydrolase [bacterium]
MRIKKTSFILSSFAIGLVCALFVYSSVFSLKSKLDKYIKAYVDLEKFSGSVLVAKDGKIVLCKGYGMANYELDVPNTPETIFRLGSVTKQFTAMAIMQLQEKGLLSVEDTLSKYISDYPNGENITIHQLLAHTSGIPEILKFPESKKKKIKPQTLEQLIEIFKNKPLDFEPGEKHSYSNSGYILLTYIIEKVSGKKYETFLKENIFDPIGMKNTGCDQFKAIIKNRASGYTRDGDLLVNADYIDMSFPAGAGVLYSKLEDLFLWNQALNSEKLLSQKSRDAMFTPHVIVNTNDPKSLSYGYGLRMGKKHNRNVILHTGGIDGFASIFCRYPDDNVCIIILSNFEFSNKSKIADDLAAIVFGEKYEIPKKRIAIDINPEIYDHYVGKYKLKEDLIITVIKENNRLFDLPKGQKKYELLPETESDFFHKFVDSKISFVKDKDGNVTRLIVREDGKDQVAEKIE